MTEQAVKTFIEDILRKYELEDNDDEDFFLEMHYKSDGSPKEITVAETTDFGYIHLADYTIEIVVKEK